MFYGGKQRQNFGNCVRCDSQVSTYLWPLSATELIQDTWVLDESPNIFGAHSENEENESINKVSGIFKITIRYLFLFYKIYCVIC